MRPLLTLILIYFLFPSCNESVTDSKKDDRLDKKESLFEPVPSELSGLHFANKISESKELNYLKYLYMYNGGGVAVGDINSDGFLDVLLGGNQVPSKLFLNKGNLVFEDITVRSGLASDNGWTTGLSMVDIDADGDLDLYLCKSASPNAEQRRNKLYLNNGEGAFTEVAKDWGIDHDGYSTQAYFFDFDKDNDLDLYLVNHLTKVESGQTIHWNASTELDTNQSDRLYENIGGAFKDISSQSGILNRCWGLSAAIGDFDNDGWEDIYVCNDFREGDLLYINQKDGTFKEALDKHFKHTSMYSMGSDYADINNDMNADLFVVDMTPSEHAKSKRNMAAMNTSDFWKMVDIGYNHQYMFNCLQLNLGNGMYADIAQLTGVEATDWSWSPLISDLDNNGWKDLLVTNGIKRDVNDRDFKMTLENRFRQGRPMSFEEVMQSWPSSETTNRAYKNSGNLEFQRSDAEWGLTYMGVSNGAAYADLDNDGDLDLIFNNLDRNASLYENKAGAPGLTIELVTSSNMVMNGTRLILESKKSRQAVTLHINRGFLSSVDPRAHFAIDSTEISHLNFYWADGTYSQIEVTGQKGLVKVNIDELARVQSETAPASGFEFTLTDLSLNGTKHEENFYDDYSIEVLLPQKMSTLGPCLVSADINADGLDDVFIGSSRGHPSSILIQSSNGSFKQCNFSLMKEFSKYEDVGALFFDADGDEDMDLIIVAGGNESPLGQGNFQPRLLLNDGKGNFTKSEGFPDLDISGQSVSSGDMDGDGDLDLFLGGRQYPGTYGVTPASYILENYNGSFTLNSAQHPDIYKSGMVTASEWVDIDGDGWMDLIIVGEWMAPTIYFNSKEGLTEKIEIPESNGWWYSLSLSDIDNDGDLDLIAGNLGENNKFHPSVGHPLELYAGDMDSNGNNDIILVKEAEGKPVPVRGRDCSSQQMPGLLQKFPTYRFFSESDIRSIYGSMLDIAEHRVATEMASCVFENKGERSFMKQALPKLAQLGPLLGLLVHDFNDDGLPDIMAAGGIYDVENETSRYDAGMGILLLNEGANRFDVVKEFQGTLPYPIRSLAPVKMARGFKVLTSENNGPIRELQMEF
jgi:hypothetical protein